MKVKEQVLETARLMLRWPRIEDAEALQSLLNTPDVVKTTGGIPYPYTLETAQAWISDVLENHESRNRYSFLIMLRDDGRLVGGIGFGVDEPHQKTEIGYWIGKPYWGRGYATEAAQTVVDYCFEVLGLNRVQATYYTSNVASRRVMEKIGMQYEGTLRQALIREIAALDYRMVHDLGHYAILRDEWLGK